MGGAVSEEAKRKMSEKTYSTEETANIILQTLLKEISTSDLIALSNPAVCSKYVLFMANDLYKHFSVLQFFPQYNDKKTDSFIVFRKVDDLIKPPDSKMIEKRQTLCLILGYYYTRIFQIYGALALTLIDDIQFMTKTGLVDIVTSPQKEQRYAYAPLQPRNEQIAGSMQVVPMQAVPMQAVPIQGGAIEDELQSYVFLKSYLEKDSRGGYPDVWHKGYKLYYRGKDYQRFTIYFSKDSNRTDRSYGVFTIEDTQTNKEYYIQVYTKREGYTTTLTFRNVTTRRDSDSSTIEMRLPSDMPIEFNNNVFTIRRQSIPTFFNTEFEYILATIFKSKSTTPTQVPQTTINELKLDRIISNLRDKRPLGHCIARAIQLLRTVPIEGKLSISHICKSRFFETSKGESRSGIPEPGKSLDRSPGLSALAQLFYDTIKNASPKLVIDTEQKVNGKTSYEQYIEFMQMMSIRFEDTNKDLRNPKTFDSGLEGIKNIRDSKMCGSNSEKDVYVPYDTATKLVTIINNMRDIQREHAAKCGRIFNMLFIIKHDSSGRPYVVLSDNLHKKGFSEIDSINHQARDILIKYYTNCEYEYVQGLQLINATKRSPNAHASSIPIIPTTNAIGRLQARSAEPYLKYAIDHPNPVRADYRQGAPYSAPATAPTAPAPTAPRPVPAKAVATKAVATKAPPVQVLPAKAPQAAKAPPAPPAPALRPIGPRPVLRPASKPLR